MPKNIDIMNDATLEAYFEMVYQESLVDYEIPYRYQLSTRPEWLEWLDKRKLKNTLSPLHDIFHQEDVWLKRKVKPDN